MPGRTPHDRSVYVIELDPDVLSEKKFAEENLDYLPGERRPRRAGKGPTAANTAPRTARRCPPWTARAEPRSRRPPRRTDPRSREAARTCTWRRSSPRPAAAGTDGGSGAAARAWADGGSSFQYGALSGMTQGIPRRGSGTSLSNRGMMWMCGCDTVWPAASPSFNPMLKPWGDS